VIDDRQRGVITHSGSVYIQNGSLYNNKFGYGTAIVEESLNININALNV
jgi:hypothetical protein